MRRWTLERILSNMYDIEAVIGYRLAPDAPSIIIATFTDQRDADRSGGDGTSTLLNIED